MRWYWEQYLPGEPPMSPSTCCVDLVRPAADAGAHRRLRPVARRGARAGRRARGRRGRGRAGAVRRPGARLLPHRRALIPTSARTREARRGVPAAPRMRFSARNIDPACRERDPRRRRRPAVRLRRARWCPASSCGVRRGVAGRALGGLLRGGRLALRFRRPVSDGETVAGRGRRRRRRRCCAAADGESRAVGRRGRRARADVDPSAWRGARPLPACSRRPRRLPAAGAARDRRGAGSPRSAAGESPAGGDTGGRPPAALHPGLVVRAVRPARLMRTVELGAWIHAAATGTCSAPAPVGAPARCARGGARHVGAGRAGRGALRRARARGRRTGGAGRPHGAVPARAVVAGPATGFALGTPVRAPSAAEVVHMTEPRAFWEDLYGAARPGVERPGERAARGADRRGLAPGRALDLGCGEGGDALWLAERGWRVTAADISRTALDRAARRPSAAGLQRRLARADLPPACRRPVRPRLGAVLPVAGRAAPGAGAARGGRAPGTRRHAARRGPRGGTALGRADSTTPRSCRRRPRCTRSCDLPRREWETSAWRTCCGRRSGPDGQQAELLDSVVRLRRRPATA